MARRDPFRRIRWGPVEPVDVPIGAANGGLELIAAIAAQVTMSMCLESLDPHGSPWIPMDPHASSFGFQAVTS